MTVQPPAPALPPATARPRRRDDTERSIVSARDLSNPRVRVGVGAAVTVFLAALLAVGAGPLLWLAKASVSTGQDNLGAPLALWPSGIQWHNLPDAWDTIRIGEYTINTLIMAGGTVLLSVFVAATGGYALAVLRPRYGPVIHAMVMATLFIPSVISLVPLYLTILDLPLLDVRLIDTYWAVWLPGAAHAFNVLIMKQFFDNLPRDLFDAARVDGAGALRVFVSLVLPMSRPIIGVVALLSFMGSWKDFLWPLLALPSPDNQPLSVAITKIENADQGLVMAGMFITVLIPLALFLIFQRQFLRSAGSMGALKG